MHAAERFGISYSAAIEWLKLVDETGSVGPAKSAAASRRRSPGRGATGCVERCREKDFTLRGLVAELGERGLKVDYRSVWEFVHAERPFA